MNKWTDRQTEGQCHCIKPLLCDGGLIICKICILLNNRAECLPEHLVLTWTLIAYLQTECLPAHWVLTCTLSVYLHTEFYLNTRVLTCTVSVYLHTEYLAAHRVLTYTLSAYLHSKCLPAHWVLTCTLSLWTSFSLTICKALERQLWANSLPYFRVNWSATMTSSCTSDCRRGVAQMMLLIGSSRPSSNSLKTSAHGFCLTGIFLCTRRPWVINTVQHILNNSVLL